MALSSWALILAVIIGIFFWLWRFAAKIEALEQEEQQWRNYIEQLRQTDPYEAMRWELLFNEKFK